MNYEGLNHLPSEDEGWLYCDDCDNILDVVDYHRSIAAGCQEPVCRACLEKQEVRFHHMVDLYLERGM